MGRIFLILLGYHAVKKTLAERGGLAEGFPDGAKAGLLVAADSAGIPGTHLQIMLMYGKEASNRKQEIDRQHYTIPNQRPKDKHCGKI